MSPTLTMSVVVTTMSCVAFAAQPEPSCRWIQFLPRIPVDAFTTLPWMLTVLPLSASLPPTTSATVLAPAAVALGIFPTGSAGAGADPGRGAALEHRNRVGCIRFERLARDSEGIRRIGLLAQQRIRIEGRAGDLEALLARARPGEQAHRAARHGEGIREEFDERLVGAILERRRGDADLEGAAVGARDSGSPGARLRVNGDHERAAGIPAVPLVHRGVTAGRRRSTSASPSTSGRTMISAAR